MKSNFCYLDDVDDEVEADNVEADDLDADDVESDDLDADDVDADEVEAGETIDPTPSFPQTAPIDEGGSRQCPLLWTWVSWKA